MEDEVQKTPVTDEIATSAKDIDVFGGWLNRLENPDPTLLTEAAGQGLKLYDEIDRDTHAGAVLQTRYLSVIGKDWEVLPGEETDQATIIADFVKEKLKNTNFNQARQELLQAILYGFFVGEVMWELSGNEIVIKRIRAKHPRRFAFTQERELRLLSPSDMIEGEGIPDRKFLRFTFGSSDNPYGKGLGQKLWWPVWFKKNGIKFWLIFLEKFGAPTAVGKYPTGTLPEQQTALLDAIDAIQNESGVKIPDTMAIELLEASRSGNASYESLCAYMDRQISKAVLGQTATTEGTPGKLGNDDVQNETKQDIVEADAGLLNECLNNSLIPWLVDYNFPGVVSYPRIHTRTEKEQDLKPLADRDKTLVSDIGLPVSKTYFYKTYNIPEPEKDAELVRPAPVKTMQGEKPNQFSEKKTIEESFAARLGKETASHIDEKIIKAMELLDEADSLKEVVATPNLGLSTDIADIGEMMSKAFMAANLAGRNDINEGK